MKKRSLIISNVLAGVILSISATGLAHACKGPNEPCPHHRGDRVDKMMAMLDFDMAQRDAMRKIRDEQNQQMRAKRDEMMKLQKAMHEQDAADKYDAAKVRELAEAQGKIMADMMVLRIETRDRIQQLLTEQQAARIEQMKKRRQERMKDRKFGNEGL